VRNMTSFRARSRGSRTTSALDAAKWMKWRGPPACLPGGRPGGGTQDISGLQLCPGPAAVSSCPLCVQQCPVCGTLSLQASSHVDDTINTTHCSSSSSSNSITVRRNWLQRVLTLLCWSLSLMTSAIRQSLLIDSFQCLPLKRRQ